MLASIGVFFGNASGDRRELYTSARMSHTQQSNHRQLAIIGIAAPP
jgi:hypothetical protein